MARPLMIFSDIRFELNAPDTSMLVPTAMLCPTLVTKPLPARCILAMATAIAVRMLAPAMTSPSPRRSASKAFNKARRLLLSSVLMIANLMDKSRSGSQARFLSERLKYCDESHRIARLA